MNINIGIISVYDPDTGLATHPVATAAWTGQHAIHWSWIPRDPIAEQLRYVTIDDLTPAEAATWLTTYSTEPTAGFSVDAVAELEAITPDTDVAQAVEDLLDALLVEGA